MKQIIKYILDYFSLQNSAWSYRVINASIEDCTRCQEDRVHYVRDNIKRCNSCGMFK